MSSPDDVEGKGTEHCPIIPGKVTTHESVKATLELIRGGTEERSRRMLEGGARRLEALKCAEHLPNALNTHLAGLRRQFERSHSPEIQARMDALINLGGRIKADNKLARDPKVLALTANASIDEINAAAK